MDWVMDALTGLFIWDFVRHSDYCIYVLSTPSHFAKGLESISIGTLHSADSQYCRQDGARESDCAPFSASFPGTVQA